MKKREFLDKMKIALMGRITPKALNENLAYYEDYINTQVRMGEREEDVIAKLGDPRLIAKSIIDSEKRKGNANEFGRFDSVDREDYQNDWNTSQNTDNSGNNYYNPFNGNGQNFNGFPGNSNPTPKKRMPIWVVLLIVFFVFFLIIGLILSIIFSVISFLAPILIPLLVVCFIVRLLRRA